MSDVPDWTRPVTYIAAGSTVTDVPDWTIPVTGAPGTPGIPTGGTGVYGDGSDATMHFDGSTTILGMAPSGGVYTLTRDFFAATITVDSGVNIITNGYRLFCAGTLTNNGGIGWDGPTPVPFSISPQGLNNANSTLNTAIPMAGRGGNGGNTTGQVGGNAAGAGYGGAGGKGGNGPGGTGGNGGTAAGPAITQTQLRFLPFAVMGVFMSSNPPSFQVIYGGAGGGGAGGEVGNPGGAGGGGGGVVIVAADSIAGTGSITARGGNGGTPTVGNAGGGGGGGGGLVVVVSGSAKNNLVSGQTISVLGGTGGTHSGSGTDGSVGVIGTTIVFAG